MKALALTISVGILIRLALHDGGWAPIYPLGLVGVALDFIMAVIVIAGACEMQERKA